MDWVGTLGGPLIVVPAGIARHWRGANYLTGLAQLNPSIRRWANPPVIDDYARACAVKGYLGLVKIGRGIGLVISGGREPAAFLGTVGGGIIFQVSYSDLPVDDICKLVAETPEEIWEPTPYRLRVSRGGLLMFDSVHAGDDLPKVPGEGANIPWMKLQLAQSTYSIDTVVYEPDSDTRLILHRFKKTARTGQKA
jgi:Immunity protein 21